MERLSEKPLVILDGGHNPGCAAALHEVLATHLSGRKITAVMGIMSDKDSMRYLARVAPQFSKIVTLAPHNPRALEAEALAEEARAFCADVTAASTIEEALAAFARRGRRGARDLRLLLPRQRDPRCGDRVLYKIILPTRSGRKCGRVPVEFSTGTRPFVFSF